MHCISVRTFLRHHGPGRKKKLLVIISLPLENLGTLQRPSGSGPLAQKSTLSPIWQECNFIHTLQLPAIRNQSHLVRSSWKMECGNRAAGTR